ncbi:hypothetical protein BG003_009061 [Podila horticola]|nr:hypothetical protein BG003_009061 [Podila horticola]
MDLQFQGATYQRGDEGYDFHVYQYASTSYKDVGNINPSFIVYAQDDADVVTAIKFAKAKGVAVAVRTGGHHYSGASSTNSNNLQLDLSRTYTDMKWEDAEYTLVTFGVSTPLGEFNKKLREHGRFVPTGQCSYVNLGGHCQSGGYGTLARGFGLFSDHIQKFRIITADAEEPTPKWVSRDSQMEEEQQLFYSVIGGSPGNFGVVTDVTLKVHKDEDHRLSRGFRGEVPYSRVVLKHLLDIMLEMGDADDFAADYDFCLTMTSERPPQHSDKPSRARIVIFAQWANLGGPNQVYNPAYFQKIIQAVGGRGRMDPYEGVLMEDKEAPMSELCSHWIFPIVREFQLPYLKNVRLSDYSSEKLRANKWTEWVTGRIDEIEANTQTTECYLSCQFQYCGGRNSRFRTQGDDYVTSFSWRDSTIISILDVFYNGDKPAAKEKAKLYQKINEEEGQGEKGYFSCEDRRLLWGSGDLDLHAAQQYYYDTSPEKYDRLCANKKKFDPNGVFTPNAFCVGGKPFQGRDF